MRPTAIKPGCFYGVLLTLIVVERTKNLCLNKDDVDEREQCGSGESFSVTLLIAEGCGETRLTGLLL